MTLLQLAILTGIEYVALMLLICKATSQFISSRIKPILIYAPIYILITLSRIYINDFVVMIIAYVSLLLFVKVIFSKMLSKAMLICLFTLLLSTTVLQTLSTAVMGLFIVGPVEFTFSNGLIAMGLTSILAILCYLCLPLNNLIQYIKKKNGYLYVIVVFFVTLILTYVLLNLASLEHLNDRMVLFDMVFAIGFSFALIAMCYYLIKFIRGFFIKKSALKQFEEIKNDIKKLEGLTAEQITNLQYYENHLEVVGWLSHMQDVMETRQYIEKYLNNFEDIENEFEDDFKPNIINLDDKVLAAYLYVKSKHLQNLGVNCGLKNWSYSSNTKITTPKLLEALSMLIDEVIETTTKERSDIRIILSREEDGRPVINIYNRIDLVSGEEVSRIKYEAYSLKTKKVGGLRKLHRITEDYDCYLDLEINKWHDGNYLKISYSL